MPRGPLRRSGCRRSAVAAGWPGSRVVIRGPVTGRTAHMATRKQVQAAKKNVKRAQAGARRKKSIANMPKKTRTALGKQAAAVAKRKRTGGSSPKTRAELYEEAKKRDLPGRSRMGRAELARALGRK